MSIPSMNAVWKRSALDSKLPVKQRLSALNKLHRPSLGLLRKLLTKGTPAKIFFRAGELLEIVLARKELLKNVKPSPTITNAD